MNASLSRRDLFSRFFGPLNAVARGRSVPAPERQAGPAAGTKQVAIIQGRFCIALTSFCSVCTERCPEPGAMTIEHGMPRVNADACTGCGVCHDVCPAPRNAVLLMPRRSPST